MTNYLVKVTQILCVFLLVRDFVYEKGELINHEAICKRAESGLVILELPIELAVRLGHNRLHLLELVDKLLPLVNVLSKHLHRCERDLLISFGHESIEEKKLFKWLITVPECIYTLKLRYRFERSVAHRLPRLSLSITNIILISHGIVVGIEQLGSR